MSTMTGGEALVRSLQGQGIETLFGIPGTHLTYVYAALMEHPEVRHIGVRHEQAAGYMADGYARASGRIAAALTVAGPGATNTMTAIAEAYADSSPVLLVSSEIESRYVGKNKGLLHEIPGLLDAFAPTTKWRGRVDDLASVPVAVAEAVRAMKSGRPRPAHIQVPVDILQATGDVEIPPAVQPERVAGSTEEIERAASLLVNAQRPFIYAGGGVILSGAGPELVRLSDMLQAPVYTTVMGKGAIPDDHPLSLGAMTYGKQHGGPPLLRKADAVLAVGTRMSAAETDSWSLAMPENLIQVDIDPGEVGKNYPARVGITGDAKQVLGQIGEVLDGHRRRPPEGLLEEVAAYRAAKRARVKANAETALSVVEQVRAALPRDGILVNDQTIVSYWSLSSFDVYEPRTFIFPIGLATLGFALPAALGAKVARPERKVVALMGDGGFMVTCQEIATAVQNGIGIVVVLFNDGGYGAIKASELRALSGRYVATDLVNPDFVQFVRSFGAEAVRLRSVEELGTALEGALENEVFTLVEVPVPLLQPPWLS